MSARKLTWIVCLTLLGLPLFSSSAARAKEAAGKPNVLFLAVDDLNDWIGALGGYPGVKTPHLDRLAKRGVVFTRAYCAAPACNPSRAALMLGLRPSTTGVYHNPQPWRPPHPDKVTLAQYFKANGYRVEGGGKIFHGGFNDPASWHQYFKRPGDPAPKGRPLNGIPKTAHFDWGPVPVGDDKMGDYQVAKWAGEFLAAKHDKPFFLAAGLFRPHLPWYVPPKYFEMYPLDKITLPKVIEDDLADVPPAGVRMARPEGDHRKVTASNNWKKAVQGYLASITFSDHCLGMILDALDKSPHADNTVVVLWSDHGWHLGEKEHWRKFALWEEASRVVLMAVVPGVTKEGQRCGRPVNLVDLYPTLVDVCGLPKKDGLDGVSLAPLLRDPGAEWDRPSITTHGRNNHAVRAERWRYIRYADGSEELYDHEKDPMEWTNLAEKAEFAEVKKGLRAWLPKTNVPDVPRSRRGTGKKTKGK